MPEMDPQVRSFLERACESAQQYDRDGQAVLPNNAWPMILEDLGLQDESDGAYFLMDHLEAYEEGYFTYTPLLQALGSALPEEARAPSARQSPGGNEGPSSVESTPPRGDPRGDTGSLGFSSASMMGGEYDQGRPQHQTSLVPHGSPGHGPPGGVLPGMGSSFEGLGGGSQTGSQYGVPRLPVSPQGSVVRAFREDFSDAGNTAPMLDLEEINEAFWAKRATAIQQLFTQWDCNQLSNETFTVRLQTLLGEQVDVSSSESEFARKTNQHRSARNLKFAMLMSALRRDAQATTARQMGVRPNTAGSVIGSYAGSAYEASDGGGSEAMHAAGRPTGVPNVAGRSRQRGVESVLSSDVHNSSVAGRSGVGGVPSPNNRGASDIGSSYGASDAGSYAPSRGGYDNQQALHAYGAAQPAPCSASGCGSVSGSMADSGYGQMAAKSPPGAQEARFGQSGGFQDRGRPPATRQAGPALDLFSSASSKPGMQGFGGGAGGKGMRGDQSDVRSQSGLTDGGSTVAESHRQENSIRNRGHGNILTWGTDSRSITPHKERQGKQITQDPGRGMPRSNVSSGIFPRQ